MCDYTQVEFRCGHVRYTVRAWCTNYETTHKRCPPSVVAIEFRLDERCDRGKIENERTNERTNERNIETVAIELHRGIFMFGHGVDDLLLCLFYLTVAFTAHPIEDFVWQYKVIPYKGHFRSSTLPRRLASDRAGKTASTSLDLRPVVAGMRWKGYRRCKPLKLEIPTSREPGIRWETVHKSPQIFLPTSTATAGRERIGRPGILYRLMSLIRICVTPSYTRLHGHITNDQMSGISGNDPAWELGLEIPGCRGCRGC
ncbi:hypothetical protein NA56DRAFT_698633 [Hyaloscypha hepaticicola]|uniref:Uncharacterized protein n=1 Tax=Hyaloscypha hepaticicola TaxID=2082293 RepID=A0A2J6QJL4_9HELO|nr:hypothetical protein NA56DRAFT_698633 [Hyaloscypha hepaticicola]